MNHWRCGVHWCPATAMGVGPATSLRALGWYVEMLGTFCPAHRPDDLTERVRHHPGDRCRCTECRSNRRGEFDPVEALTGERKPTPVDP